jgi:nicotinamide riboside transporter PnuC
MEIWSWVLAAIGVSGIFFVGQKTIWGWLILLVNECLWIVYAVTTQQYGFIFAALAYATVYIRSFLHWRKDA